MLRKLINLVKVTMIYHSEQQRLHKLTAVSTENAWSLFPGLLYYGS